MDQRQDVDCIVLGGGIVGAATADILARRNVNVLLIDQFEPGHTHGSSHGDGRIIRIAYPEPLYVEMARQAYPRWAELEARAGRSLGTPTGGLDIGLIEAPELAGLAENFERLKIPHERLSAAQIRRRFPTFQVPEEYEGIFQRDTGVLYADAAVKLLWELTGEAGGNTVTHEKITRVALEGSTVRLTAASGRQWTASRLIIAAGSWAGLLLNDLGLTLPLTVTQEQVAFFKSTPGTRHTTAEMPVLIDHSGSNLFALPQIEVPGVKVGLHHHGRILDDPELSQPVDQKKLALLKKLVARRFPHLEPEPFKIETCRYTNTPDRHFILDRHPDAAHVVIGAGFSGHGFKFAPLLGELLTALALGEEPPVPLDSFSLQRLAEPERLTQRVGA